MRLAREFHRILPRQSDGTVLGQLKEMLTLSIILVGCTITGVVSRRVIQKRTGGISLPQIRAMLVPRTILVFFIITGMECRWIQALPAHGFRLHAITGTALPAATYGDCL
jgi:hypothetical protein